MGRDAGKSLWIVEADMKLRTSIIVGMALLLTGATAWSAPSTPSKPTRGTSKPRASAASKARAKKVSKHSKRRQPGQKAPAPERISEIQQALAKDGSFGGTPNGKWDDSTAEATRKFQASHGLNPSGRLDAPTLQKLGLGSQTAGVAAPMPPITSSSIATKAGQTAQRQ
jgi:peptidoglycan hydrolase-like protein with peptidoglycan-binding domain